MIRVLCVEDEIELRKTLEEVLEEEGFEVKSVANGAEAIRSMESFVPHVVIADWLMPVMNGLEMIREMRAEGSRFSDIPVIVTSAYAAEGEISEAIAMGACKYLTKPVDFDTLLTARRDFGVGLETATPLGCGCRLATPLAVEDE